MLYYLFDYLEKFDFPGAGMFQYLSFRAGMAIITSLIISLLFGKKIINYLRKKQIGEEIRDLGLEGQKLKVGTPTMGGIIILASILIPVLLFGDLLNIYVILMIITTLWLGIVGFIDDYIKVFNKNKKGLAGRFKIAGQIILGLIVSVTMLVSNDVFVRERIAVEDTNQSEILQNSPSESQEHVTYVTKDIKSTITTIPFFKNNEFDYSYLLAFLGKKSINRIPFS